MAEGSRGDIDDSLLESSELFELGDEPLESEDESPDDEPDPDDELDPDEVLCEVDEEDEDPSELWACRKRTVGLSRFDGRSSCRIKPWDASCVSVHFRLCN